ncbi:alpha/beta hydrolase [Streptomyces griseorubiginosus]|uniref:alpha/beta hydrolase n=1 Tax=Streptomyces griseorubiginosus TaxID=67304 RepID=UPI001AD6B2F0|nr:alpha/beta hydrolase [Streptomyces griseorubiginosus]MBO4253123.1 alpha/beta hydrolase fold domain-containing protein [Streptomyces griseorubiginosus]
MSDPTAALAAPQDEAAVRAHNAKIAQRYLEGLSQAPKPALTLPPPDVRVIRDLAFGRADGAEDGTELRMDLYLPTGSPLPAPVIVWLPGGGWRMQRRGNGPNLTRLFAQRGYAMADVEYRSSAVAIWPAQLDDVTAALRHLRRIAPEYGLDVDAVGLWGSSSGGHLALHAGFAGARPDREDQPAVRAVVAGYPCTDLLSVTEDALPGGILADQDPDDPSWGLLGGRPADLPDLARDASPVHHVGPGVPPVLLLHGDADLVMGPAQAHRLFDALVAGDAEAHLLMVHGADHGFLNTGVWENQESPYRATLRSSRDAAGTRERAAILTPGLIERFFDRHLRREPWGD